MPIKTTRVIPILFSQCRMRLAGGIALLGFSVLLSLLIVTRAAFTCYKFEVYLSMLEENG